MRTSWYKDEADNDAGHRTSKSVIWRMRIPKARANKEFVVLTDRIFVGCCCWDWEDVGWFKFEEVVVTGGMWRREWVSPNMEPKWYFYYNENSNKSGFV